MYYFVEDKQHFGLHTNQANIIPLILSILLLQYIYDLEVKQRGKVGEKTEIDKNHAHLGFKGRRNGYLLNTVLNQL